MLSNILVSVFLFSFTISIGITAFAGIFLYFFFKLFPKLAIEASIAKIALLLMLVVSVGFIAFNAYDLRYGLDTIWDEGFYIQWMKKENNFLNATQSFNILNKIGFKEDLDILNLRVFRFSLQFFTIVLFSFLGWKWLKKEHGKPVEFKYILLLIVFSLLSFEVMAKLICYRHLQQFFALISLILFLFYLSNENRKRKVLYLSGTTFLLTLSILNIPPSGLLLSLMFGLSILIKERCNVKNLLFYLTIYITGFIVSLIILNFFLVDFSLLIPELTSISSVSDQAHSLHKIINPYIFTSKIFVYKLTIGLFVIVAYLLLRKKFNNPLITYLFFTFVVSVLFSITGRYLRTYGIYNLILPVLLIAAIHLSKNYSYQKVKSSNVPLSYLLLFIFPFITSFGTNTPIETHALFYISSWGLLLSSVLIKYEKSISNLEISLVFIFSTFVVLNLHYYYFYDLNSFYLGNSWKSKHSVKSIPAIRNLYIRKEQKDYFLKIQSILDKHNFKPNMDYMFSFCPDFITIHLFSGVLVGNPYHQVDDYLADHNKYKIPRPKFIFIREGTDSKALQRDNNWGFPESYDKFYLGNPEISEAFYCTDRWLYCSKY